MKRALRKYWWATLVIIALVIGALLLATYVLQKQRVAFPKWMPFIGTSYSKYSADLKTAQSVIPGQGQAVTIAGVDVGDITDVSLINGHANVDFRIKDQYAKMMRADATVLTRPKTGLNDMVLELDPGSKGEQVKEGFVIPLAQSATNVNPDEVLGTLDGDTRQSLQLLINGFGEGVKGQPEQIKKSIKQLPAVTKNLRLISQSLNQRRGNIRRVISGLEKVTGELASSRGEVVKTVDSANALFKITGDRNQELSAAIKNLPSTLAATNRSLGSLKTFANELAPSSKALLPVADRLTPALKASTPFLRDTEPALREQFTPFAKDTKSVVRQLGLGSGLLADAEPDLAKAVGRFNEYENMLVYDPPGEEQGYLFWAEWAAHNASWLFALQDANGIQRRIFTALGCGTLGRMAEAAQVSPVLGLLNSIVKPLDENGYCPKGQQGEAADTTVKKSASSRGVGMPSTDPIAGSIQAPAKELGK